MQLFGQRHQIDGLLRLPERDHVRKHAAVLIQEKILRTQILNRRVKRVVIEDDGAENGTLGFEVAGKGSFERGVDGHESLLFLRLFFAKIT